MKEKLPFANKDLGQHFLRDQKVISSITDDRPNEVEALIEVGPGPAILTENLSKHDLPFKVVEKDTRFLPYISKFVPEEHIHFSDALKVNFEALFPHKKIWLVSNLPYNVSVPLFLKFLRTPSIKWLTLMFQREVGDKIFRKTEVKNQMGSLMALGRTYFECREICKVPPGAFAPPPKVDSIVLGFKRRENPVVPLEDFEKFESFLRRLFEFKRKQVQKVLKAHYPIEKLSEALLQNGMKPTDRAEIFSLDQIHGLFSALKKM